MTEKIVNKGFKIRIYPTDEQKTIIEKTFGCCRFIYNNYLQEKNEFYIEHKSELKGKTKEEKQKFILILLYQYTSRASLNLSCTSYGKDFLFSVIICLTDFLLCVILNIS